MSERSWQNRRGIGKVYVRHGRLWTSVGDKRMTTGIEYPVGSKVEQKKAVAAAKKVLEARVRDHENPVVVEAASAPQKTLYEAIAEFKRIRFGEMSRSIQSRYRMAFAHFLVDEKHGDMTITFEGLKNRIVEMKETCTLEARTRQKVLYKLDYFLRYCVTNDWITRNPMDAITIGKVDRDEHDIDRDGAVRFELEEMEAIRGWLHDHGYARHVEYVTFLELTGCRPIEGLRARAEHRNDRTMRIMGKIVRGNNSGIRVMPLVDESGEEVRPGLLPFLSRLIENADRFDGYLFPWRTLSSVQPVFKECREALKITGGRSLKTYRSTANWYFREHLRWDREFRCLWLGHSVAVNRMHYEAKRTPEEIVRAASSRYGSSS